MPFLPGPRLVETDGKLDWVDNSVDAGGAVHRPYASLLGAVRRGLARVGLHESLGPDLKRASELAVLNANYTSSASRICTICPSRSLPCTNACSRTRNGKSSRSTRWTSPSALIDCGIHPPTIYFPLVVHGAIMIEPTDRKISKDLDAFIEAMRSIAELARNRCRPVACLSDPD